MKTAARTVRHRRVRKVVAGTAERPRLVVFRGTKTLSAQFIDDATGSVLLSASAKGANIASGTKLGAELAKLAKAKKITTAVFDRAGYAYHGVVRAVCEAVRESGVTV